MPAALAQCASFPSRTAATATTPVSGEQWIASSQFFALSDEQVADKLVATVKQSAKAAASGLGRSPVVVIDLDDTLYSNDRRMLSVLNEWAKSPGARNKFPEESNAIAGLRLEDIRYSLRDNVLEAGIGTKRAADVLADLQPFFSHRFFDGAHALIDPTIPEVARLVRNLATAGAKVVFLSGRDAKRQGEATRASLARDGFGIDGRRFFLMLKESAFRPDGQKLSDLEFKQQALQTIDKIGDVIATLDNEPAETELFSRLIPDAANVFVKTHWSDTPVPPAKGLYKLEPLTR